MTLLIMLTLAARRSSCSVLPGVLSLTIAAPGTDTRRRPMLKNRARIGIVLPAISLAIPVITPARKAPTAKAQRETKANQNLIREVRHQLLLLPYYSVF